MRRAFGDVLLSAGALGVLLIMLVSVDARVREQVSLRMHPAQASADLVRASRGVTSLAAVVYQAAADQAQLHAPLMVFVVAATILTLFMVRT